MRLVTGTPRFLSLTAGVAAALWLATMSPRWSTWSTVMDRAIGMTRVSAAAEAGMQTPAGGSASAGAPLKILFLGGDQPPHPAAAVFQSLAAPLARRGIQLTPTLSPTALTEKLSYYDGLILYGNHTTLAPDQEKALIDFVESGKGVVAIHSAIEMFGGSTRYAS